jgi:hypothetical protein
MVEHQMELEAEEPANAAFAPRGQIGEYLVPADAAIVAYGQRRAVDVVDARPASHPAEQEHRQWHPYMVGQSDEAGITRGLGKGRTQQSQDDAFVEGLEMPEMRTVIQHQDGHDLAISQPRWWSPLLGRLCLLPQQPSVPVRVKGLAKIVKLAEILHEPVEHGCLHTSDGADSKRESQGLQSLGLTSNP